MRSSRSPTNGRAISVERPITPNIPVAAAGVRPRSVSSGTMCALAPLMAAPASRNAPAISQNWALRAASRAATPGRGQRRQRSSALCRARLARGWRARRPERRRPT